jgi:hypothetical protein
MGLRHVSAKFSSWWLTAYQKEHCFFVACDLFRCVEADENLFKCVVTGDEPWMHSYNLETKQRSSRWQTSSSLQPSKVCELWWKPALMLVNFSIMKLLCVWIHSTRPNSSFSGVHREPNGISWFLCLWTVCGLGWLIMMFQNSLLVLCSKVICNHSAWVHRWVS